MIAFWISAALVSAAAAALIIHRAARAVRTDGEEDPALSVYRRQLAEIDDLAERGLLLDDERRSAHTEAARRLLAAAEDAPPPAPPSRSGRLVIAAVAGLAPLAAIGIYLLVGSPGLPDQPFARRLTAWRAADPTTLSPEQMAAVLQLIVRERPKDPDAFFYLSRAELASGDAFSATQALQQAISLAPRRADLWSGLGETYVALAQGDVSDDAVKAFRQAAQIDPTAPAPRYYLARARIAGGDVDGGLADWRALDAALPAADPRRAGLEQEIALVARTRALPQLQSAAPEQAAAGAPQGQRAFIRSMVASLAARLQANPDDPAGWARLIRSYAVLGDRQSQDAALAKARAQFKDRPDDLRRVEQAASAPQ
jgi:cytochrome c-type biogenesis protein CcmH